MTERKNFDQPAMTPEQWDRLVAGWEPSEVDLARAPILHDWYPTWRRGGICVVGRVSYHHRLDEGTVLGTSPVLKFAEDGSWLRTRREYYRLGKRFERRSAQEVAEAALGPAAPGSLVRVSDHWDARPDFDPFPDLPLPPLEDEDTSARP